MTSLRIDDAPGGAWPEAAVIAHASSRHREPVGRGDPVRRLARDGCLGHEELRLAALFWIAASLRSSQ